jgi:hypothetical protein
MRRMVIMAGLALTGCYTPPAPNYTSADMEANTRAHTECLIDAITRFDDGITAPREIGILVAPICDDVLERFIEQASANQSARFEIMLRDSLRANAREQAGRIVLAVRAQHSAD